MAVQSSAKICQAEVEGAHLGSREITFTPGPVQSGDYHFSISTAGSTTLVLQTLLPALLKASGPSTLIIEGGTHNDFAPPYPFLEKTFQTLLSHMGAEVSLELQQYGFYPVGGGRIKARIHPYSCGTVLSLKERGAIRRIQAFAYFSQISVEIAKRELKVIQQKLGLEDQDLFLREVPHSPGPGNALCVEVESESLTEVFTSFGRVGVRAEMVAEEVCRQVQAYLVSGAPVGEYLADQLLLPMALAGGGYFVTGRPSLHMTTNCDVIPLFLDISIQIEPQSDTLWTISLKSQS